MTFARQSYQGEEWCNDGGDAALVGFKVDWGDAVEVQAPWMINRAAVLN